MGSRKSTGQFLRDNTHTQINTLVDQNARLHQALNQFGLFFEAAHERDPLPLLRELTCELFQADDLQIDIPAGRYHPSDEDSHILTQSIALSGRTVGRFTARRARPFDTQDHELAFVVGQVLGIVLEQLSLYSQVEQYQQQAQANADTLDRLLVFKRQVVSNLGSPEQIALTLAALIPDMIGCERASLLLTSMNKPNMPQLVLSNGTVASSARARTVHEEGLAGLVFRERRPLIIDETDTDRRWMSLEQYGSPTRCAMAAPLIWGDQILGVLTVTTTRSRLFNTSHLNLLELIAHNISLALYSANFKARITGVQTDVAHLLHQLNNALMATSISFQQLLPETPGETDILISVRAVEKVAETLEALGEAAAVLNVAHAQLLTLLTSPTQTDDSVPALSSSAHLDV